MVGCLQSWVFTGWTLRPAQQTRICELLVDIADKRLSMDLFTRLEVCVYPATIEPSPQERLHKVWRTRRVADLPSPLGLPRLAEGTLCPAGAVLAEVSYIRRPSGGMGSFYQFDGYFVSIIFAPGFSAILDARLELAK
jgi:hypothetical protein